MAAPILGLEDIGLQRGDGWLFEGLNLFVDQRDRLALVGRNGAGKSSLIQLIDGRLDFDRGRRTLRPGLRIALLEQDPPVAGFATLRDYALHPALDGSVPESYQIDAVAMELGLDLDRPAATASGGERRRAALARVFALEVDLLLMDEPTNHLDLAAIEWLEARLGRFNGAFIAISHDRMFLARLTRDTIWLDRGTLRRASIGFGGFEAWQDKAIEEEERAAERLNSQLRKELHWLARGVTARRKRNQGRLRKLQDMRAQRAAMTGAPGTARLALETSEQKSKSVITLEQVSKSYGDKPIIRNLSIRIQAGDRIGIVGPNGAGKTTLLKLLTGQIEPDSGTVRIASTLDTVLVDQQRSRISASRTVREVLADGGDWIDVRGEKKHVAGYLKDFLFDPALADARVDTLSGGEQSRLLLAREFARPSNLLVLDEPTNDLDLDTLDLLQETIADFAGTVLLVSHDRDFLDRSVTMVIGLDGSGTADVIVGGYSDWDVRRKAAAGQPTGNLPRRSTPATSAPGASPASRGATNPAKLSYKDQRALDMMPQLIESLTSEIAELETALADPDLYMKSPDRFAALSDKLDAKRQALNQQEERWLELMEMAEAIAVARS